MINTMAIVGVGPSPSLCFALELSTSPEARVSSHRHGTKPSVANEDIWKSIKYFILT